MQIMNEKVRADRYAETIWELVVSLDQVVRAVRRAIRGCPSKGRVSSPDFGGAAEGKRGRKSCSHELERGFAQTPLRGRFLP